MNDAHTHTEKRHPIQVAAKRSGLSQDVLRAWEKRYAVVRPGRSGGRQRLYSDADIERLRLLKQAVDGGRRISDVAALPDDELSALALGDRTEAVAARHLPVVDPVALVECLDAIERLDSVRLEEVLSRHLLDSGSLNLIEGLVAPVMVEVGRRWHEGELSASHEHMATEILRGLVSRVLAESQPRRPEGTLVVATTQDQAHEVGGLMAAALAAHERWRVVYLGARLPSSDIVAAARQVEAGAVVLSYAFSTDAGRDVEHIREVADTLDPGMELIVGGAAAVEERETLVRTGAHVVDDLPAFRRALDRLRPRR